MKTHRNILIISFIIGVSSFPFLIFLSQGKLYEFMLAMLSSSIIAFLLELPNYFSIKNENRNKLYYSLYSAKTHASYLIDNINNMRSLYDKFYSQNVNDMDMDIRILETFDNNYYFRKNKNTEINTIKTNLRSSWHNINLASLQFSIEFTKMKINRTAANQNDIIYINEMNEQIELIINSCKMLIKAADDIAPLVFNKSQMRNWINDNIILTNNKINIKVSKT